jgi:ketosteroid isomerase-like protein
VEPSEEIRRVIERWTKAIADGDGDTVLGRLSNERGTLIVGTDPAEWWRGAEAHAVWSRQILEIGRFPIVATEVDAWEEGSVGWAGVKEVVSLETGAFESRATYVLHLERGEWKVVQVHWVVPALHRRDPRTHADGHHRAARADDPARTARSLGVAGRRRHRHDRVHGHRGLHADAHPSR